VRDIRSDALPFDNRWHHVACTFDQVDGELTVYVDGSIERCEETDEQLLTIPGGTSVGVKANGTFQGDWFVGRLDNVHVFARTLTPAEICAAAGKPAGSCNASCPSSGPGGGGQ